MSFPDHPFPFTLSPPMPFAADMDAIEVFSQFPMNNEPLDPHSPFDQPPPFKRSRTSETVKKGTSHIFFKTRLCAKFKMGTCRNGENCNFAHGTVDMRQPPSNWQEIVGIRHEERSSGNWDDDQKIIHKMKLCKKYYNGEECPYGERCTFLHEDPAKFRDDWGRMRESSAISIGTNGSPKSHGNGSFNSDSDRHVNISLDSSLPNVKSTYWKTKLCIKWDTTGHCPFGDKCHFAHGRAELQVGGERVEGEGTGPISVCANYDASARNEEEQGKKRLGKWKGGPKKMNGIYADWLDDSPLHLKTTH